MFIFYLRRMLQIYAGYFLTLMLLVANLANAK